MNTETIAPMKPCHPKPLTVASLFAGIGGLEKGLASSGHETMFQCELLETARAVLRSQFPECERRSDVTKLTSLPNVDLITAGFPCQDLSQAGRGGGIRGQQSSLIDCVFNLIEKKRQRPEWLLLENVPFMLQLNRGEAMTHVVREVERLGYRWAYRVIDARSFGLPQRRRRVIFLASRTHQPCDVIFVDDEGTEPIFDEGANANGFYWTEGNRGLGWTTDGVPTLKGGSGFAIPSPPAIWLRDECSIVTPDIRDAERMQGFPENWTVPALDHVKRRGDAMRWKLVGNAVSVPVARWVGRRLRRPGKYDPTNDAALTSGQSWPTSCWGGEGKAFVASVSEWPKHYQYQPLDEFLRYEPTKLSLRATRGFFGRLQNSQLRRPEEFDLALQAHINRMSDRQAVNT